MNRMAQVERCHSNPLEKATSDCFEALSPQAIAEEKELGEMLSEVARQVDYDEDVDA